MGYLSTHLSSIIKEILVKEIGEANISPLKWKQINPSQFNFNTNIEGKQQNVTVDFEHMDKDILDFYFSPSIRKNIQTAYNIAYNVEGNEYQFAQSDLKTILVVMSTIVDIVKYFIFQNNPDGLYIKGNAKVRGGENTSKKNNLYDAYIQSQIKTLPGYSGGTGRDGGFIIVKNK
jgi:hypothetical protein